MTAAPVATTAVRGPTIARPWTARLPRTSRVTSASRARPQAPLPRTHRPRAQRRRAPTARPDRGPVVIDWTAARVATIDPRAGPPRAADLSASEAAEVAAARGSVAAERAELEAAEASPEALAAGQRILETLMGHLGFDARVEVAAGETSRLNVVAQGDDSRRAGCAYRTQGRAPLRAPAPGEPHALEGDRVVDARSSSMSRTIAAVVSAPCANWPIAPLRESSRPARCSSWSRCLRSSDAEYPPHAARPHRGRDAIDR